MTPNRLDSLWTHPGCVTAVGLATADITPPVGIYCRNWAAAEHDTAESVHRPLQLAAMTMRDEQGRELVLVEGDLSWWRELDSWYRFRDRVLAATGLNEGQFLFALSHSHASPPLTFDPPPAPGTDLLRDWLEQLERTTIELIQRARAGAEPAIIDWHHGRCTLAQNRDFAPDGTGRYVCGFNPLASPGDETLLVGRIAAPDGRLRGLLANYACHPTTLAFDNRAVSPDFVGAFRARVAEATGAPVLFLQGASGELAPRFQYTADPEVADRHGEQLAYAVLATLADMEPPGQALRYQGCVQSGAPLGIWRYVPHRAPTVLSYRKLNVEIPLKEREDLSALEAALASERDRVRAERLRRKLHVMKSLGSGTTWTLPVYLWRTGDAYWVASMAEAYSLLQRMLRAAFPGRAVVCLNLVNGSIGYLPPEGLYERELYQVQQSPFAAGSLERVIDAVTLALRSWDADTMPRTAEPTS